MSDLVPYLQNPVAEQIDQSLLIFGIAILGALLIVILFWVWVYFNREMIRFWLKKWLNK